MDESLLARERLRSGGSDMSDLFDEVANPSGKWFVPEDFLSPILGTTVLVPFAVAFVGVVGSGAKVLFSSFPALLSSVLLSQAVSSFYFAAFSQFTACTNIDLLTAAYLAKLAYTLEGTVPDNHLVTAMLVGQGLFTLMLGTLLYVFAKYDVMWYLRFLPYPVSCGFVSGVGLLILDGGLELGAGTNLWDVVRLNRNLPPVIAFNLAVVVASGTLFITAGHFTNSALRLPMGVVIVSALFHVVVQAFDIPLETLEAHDVFLHGLTSESWTREWSLAWRELPSLDLSVFVSGPVVTMTFSYLLLHLISYPFYAAGMVEVDLPKEKYDLKKEIKTLACANLIGGLLMGVPVSHSYKVTILMKSSGGRTRTWVVALALALSGLYFMGSLRVGLAQVPKCAFGGLVLGLGIEFLLGSLFESRTRIAPAEWRFVIMTAVMTYFNVLVGLAFGSLLMMSFFIMEYSGITGIVYQGTLAEVRSVAERPEKEMQALDKNGHRAVVFWISGYIFFGTASNIVEEVEDHITDFPQTRIVIIDFELVPAVDASGIHALTEFASRCAKLSPPIQVCFCGMVRRLKLAVTNVVEAKHITPQDLKLDCHNVEQALVWAERRILFKPDKAPADGPVGRALEANAKSAGTRDRSVKEDLAEMLRSMAPDASTPDVEAVCASLLGSAVRQVHGHDDAIFEEGSTANELVYILSGVVAVTRGVEMGSHHKMPRYHLNEAKGDLFTFEERVHVRIQQAQKGALMGCIEFGASLAQANVLHATSLMVLSKSCHTLHVPFHELRAALAAVPVLGQPVTSELGAMASVHCLRLLQSANVKPYRLVGAHSIHAGQALTRGTSAVGRLNGPSPRARRQHSRTGLVHPEQVKAAESQV